ncbi:MAG: chemotaxis-specific protein-glutamate methyltransferase CheB [Gemmatimonadetes bacterium]|nr:chemotaxis-specific protein-glutamate methyltransferase CheB [Gemmatimonadota bacterium]
MPARVLVVDDSAFMRRLIRDLVEASGEFEVVGTAKDGAEALALVSALAPDVVTLDIDMPGMDGLTVLRRIMATAPRPVVMLSAGGSDGVAAATLQALDLGAVDFVRKPSGSVSLDLEVVRDELLVALRAAAHAIPRPAAVAAAVSSTPRVVVGIAASTGGPAALGCVVPALPPLPDVAVLVVQHMPPGFTASFARRLHGVSRFAVREAEHGEAVCGGTVYVAPAGQHLRLVGPRSTPTLALDRGPTLWGVRPSADICFASIAEVMGAASVGVVLTGMGRDGADGAAAIRAAGGRVLIQSAESCVVPGMPDAALRAAGADAIAPLETLAGTLVALTHGVAAL